MRRSAPLIPTLYLCIIHDEQVSEYEASLEFAFIKRLPQPPQHEQLFLLIDFTLVYESSPRFLPPPISCVSLFEGTCPERNKSKLGKQLLKRGK